MLASFSMRPDAASHGIFLASLIPRWGSSLPIPRLRELWPERRAIERFLTFASFAVHVLYRRDRAMNVSLNASVLASAGSGSSCRDDFNQLLQCAHHNHLLIHLLTSLYWRTRELENSLPLIINSRQLATAVDMSTQIDIKRTLQEKFGDESEFPSWTTPFIAAVGLLEELEDHVIDPNDLSNWIPPESRREGEGSRAGPTATEREMERIGEEVVTNLEAVSIDRILYVSAAEFHSRGRPSNFVMERSLFPSYGSPTSTSKSKTGPRQDHPR
jgi:hypothetical protein